MSQHTSTTANLVGIHYRVGRKIGEGSFGVIFEGPLSFEFLLPTSSRLPVFLLFCRDQPSQFSDRRHQICTLLAAPHILWT